MRKFFNDEAGLVVSAELVLVVSLIFTAVAVGLAAARDALTQELNDISEMIGTVDQTYNVSALKAPINDTTSHGSARAMGFNDRQDACDCKDLQIVTICIRRSDNKAGGGEWRAARFHSAQMIIC